MCTKNFNTHFGYVPKNKSYAYIIEMLEHLKHVFIAFEVVEMVVHPQKKYPSNSIPQVRIVEPFHQALQYCGWLKHKHSVHYKEIFNKMCVYGHIYVVDQMLNQLFWFGFYQYQPDLVSYNSKICLGLFLDENGGYRLSVSLTISPVTPSDSFSMC